MVAKYMAVSAFDLDRSAPLFGRAWDAFDQSVKLQPSRRSLTDQSNIRASHLLVGGGARETGTFRVYFCATARKAIAGRDGATQGLAATKIGYPC